MSEEDIIKDVTDFNNITVLYGQIVLLKSQLIRYQNASKGLLDLYSKEKEKNKELQNYMKECLIPKSTINYLYIDKDKIRKKIEQIKMNANYDWIFKYDYQDVVKILEELLEETNE